MISLKTQKILWGRAAGRCSKPDCRMNLFEDETLTDDPTLVGENCHIVAESDGGPRSDPSMSQDKRDSYANLILLCRNHHKVIDAHVGEHTVEKLQLMKAVHEKWVAEQLGVDQQRLSDDQFYAGLIDEWERLAEVDNWLGWTSYMLGSGQPSIFADVDASLNSLRPWLLTRVWPGRYIELENALHNFRRVLDDLYGTFHKHVEVEGDRLWTRKFYRIDRWDEALHARMSNRFDHHVDLVEDLVLELTRAANLVCDRVRATLQSGYRLKEGRLAVMIGPLSDLSFRTMVVQYDAEVKSRPFAYPGLDAFMVERGGRDFCFGNTPAPSDRDD